MKSFLFAAALATCLWTQAGAQTESKLPELPAPAGSEPSMPALPNPASTYDTIPEAPTQPVVRPQQQMSQEEIEKLKKDENWLVEGLKKKQEDDAAAAALKKSSEMSSKNEEPPKPSTFQPGEFSGFKPALSNSSLASLDLNQNQNRNNGPNPAAKKKTGAKIPTDLDNSTPSSNPLSTSTNGLVQPILGPSRQPTNTNIANLNPGLRVTPLPSTSIKKISSNPNFIPDGYADSWTKQQQYDPYKPQASLIPKPVPPSAAPLTARPTFRDLANTIPDPTNVR